MDEPTTGEIGTGERGRTEVLFRCYAAVPYASIRYIKHYCARRPRLRWFAFRLCCQSTKDEGDHEAKYVVTSSVCAGVDFGYGVRCAGSFRG